MEGVGKTNRFSCVIVTTMYTLISLLFTVAVAAPPGYERSKSGVEGCNLFLGPADANGTVPMLAECEWPDVTVEAFAKSFDDWEHHDEIFSTVADSKVLRVDGARSLLHQRHQSSGISDREAKLWATRAPVDGGGFRYSWTLAKDEALTPASGNVAAAFDDGHWIVRPRAAGGVTAEHKLVYDPGGRVPGFLVRWFQTSGLAATVTEARAACK